MTRRRILLFLPVAAILAVAAVFYFLMHTGPGARWLWERTAGLLPGQLQAAAVDGDLQSGLRLQQVSYRDEGLSVRADRLGVRLDLDLLPPSVAVHELDFGTLEIRTAPGDEESPAPLDAVLEAMSLPVPVRFGDVRGERLVWRSEADGPGTEIRSLAFSAAWFKDLAVEDLNLILTEPSMRWAGEASLGLAAPFELELEARGDLAAEALSLPGGSLDLRLRARGNLAELSVNAESGALPAQLSGRLLELLDRPSWDLQLASDRLAWPLDAGDPVLIGRFSASSYGSLGDYGLELEAAFDERAPPGLAGLRGRLVGAGDLETLQIEVLEISSESVDLGGSGRVGWSDGFSAEGAVTVERANPSPWFDAWGEAEPFSGELDLAWRDGWVEFSGREVRAPGTVGLLAGNGTFDAEGRSVDARLDWRELAWPPGASEPDLLSPVGSVQIAGRPVDWSVDGELELQGAEFPRGRATVRGTGDTESVALEIPRGEILGGSLEGQVALRWAPETTWSARAAFRDLLTAPLAPAWPGKISGEASLQARAEPLALDADIVDLNGMLRDRPVAARGALHYAADSLLARDLHIRYGTSELALDGDMGGRAGLNFRARIDSLGDLADGAAGSVDGEGMVSLDPANPTIVLNLEGQNLAWGDYSVDALRVTTPAEADAQVRVEGERLGMGETWLESLVLITDSRRPLDVIEADADLGQSRLELAMSGRIVDWSAPLDGGWHGVLQRFRWAAGSEEWAELEEPVELALNRETASVAPGCLRGQWQGRMCLEGRWRQQGESEFDASLENVSPNLALRLADSDLIFSHMLSGTVTWRQEAAEKPRAVVDLTLSAGDVRIEDEDEAIITTGRGRFGFEIAEGRLFAGNLDIPMPGSGGIDTDFSAPDLANGLESPVEGRLQLNLKDIGPFLELIPDIEGSSGPVAADLRFSGTAADPRFTGHVSLVRGRLSHFATGLQLDDLKLAGAVYEFDQTELSGTFRAGEGRGSIRAVVNFHDILAPELLVQLDGEGLTLVDVPDLNVKADPDVRLTWRGETLGIAGRVRVPSARLSPRYLPTSSASESPDVVIVAGEDPMAEVEENGSSEWGINGELELELGEDVRLQLERATARLRGTAVFTWEDEQIPTAAGGFEVDGEIYAYGQLLSVTEGQVNFAKRPADNPFLTIRAEREIFGNSQVRRAGVLVTGTLKRPVLETYTDPMTTRERALTLLVTGSDFNYEQGVGAVEVGMYVAPKLFISYGIGLFDDQNVISARYDLGKGFGVKATSGQRETGVDISYTIER